MPPVPRLLPRFAAEPPQEGLPYGRWSERLGDEFLAACEELQQEQQEDLGETGEIVWHPERTWNGRTYVPATTLTSRGYEIFGHVSFARQGSEGRPAQGERDTPAQGEPDTPAQGEPDTPAQGEQANGELAEMAASADFTEQTAERNEAWKLDICDEVIGAWRGESGAAAQMTLVWGRALLHGGRVATAELGEVTVDQCVLIDERFTLIAPDDYQGDLLEIKLFDGRGRELASESLYETEDDGVD